MLVLLVKRQTRSSSSSFSALLLSGYLVVRPVSHVVRVLVADAVDRGGTRMHLIPLRRLVGLVTLIAPL